ncbi:MarR family winged helix-turn-helix transcriptional regulator [Micromonospora sp. 4G55]|uniref:MarR family winged helix-turn-helix transcriptional regulator n=1 Tax=Micromonospora sp. 4G55 TaxID=2806102 RepID=UPI001A6290BC|nr:MarR family winged helix-turn-helix transcriptional regulator [Micromonospora sp. 4G55]MBM0260904.1 winged helix-turn-helix transcriptional regulator [Micromonospora sp. 4G55]
MTQSTAATGSDLGDRSGLAGDAVRRIMHIASAIRHYQDVEIGGLGLTPAAARALDELDPDRPLPARDLAEQLRCDRSNVTALVDKLEQAGLVERRVDPADRRQKTLVVTDAGRRMRERVHRVMSDSRLLAGLSTDELATLRELVWKVSDGGCPEQCGPE